jgi:PPOX class probable F420-dependent enzyme
MALSLDDAFSFVGVHNRGVLVTRRANGRPQLSNIFYVPGAEHAVRISVTDSRAKTRNLRRDPLASLHVTQADFYAYVVIDGRASLSPVAQDGHDAVVEELVEMYRLGQGDHPDWGEFRQAMVDQGRVVATLTADSAYGMIGN